MIHVLIHICESDYNNKFECKNYVPVESYEF